VLRTLVESGRNDVDGVAINAHLLKNDSVHGRLDPEVEVDGNTLLVGGLEIHVSADPRTRVSAMRITLLCSDRNVFRDCAAGIV